MGPHYTLYDDGFQVEGEIIPGKINILSELKKNLAYVELKGPLTHPKAKLVFLRYFRKRL